MIKHAPFRPHPEEHVLKVNGILLGTHHQTGYEVWWIDDEQQYPMLV